MEIVDAHHHLWDLRRNRYPWLVDEPMIPFRYGDYGKIRRDYLAADYRRDSARQSIVATVHMEAEIDPAHEVDETRWIHEVAEANGFPNAVVGHARLERDDVADVLAGHAGYPLVRSIRQKPRAAASPGEVVRGAPGSMGDKRWREGFSRLTKHRLSYDLQTSWWHLAEAAELARDFADTPIILNHTGLPADRSRAGLAGWREGMETFAAQPNARIKISGLGQPGQPWTLEANRPIIRETIRMFGVDRCMFASNFPVDGVCADFDTIFDGFKVAVADLPAADQRKLFRDNAARIYRIGL